MERHARGPRGRTQVDDRVAEQRRRDRQADRQRALVERELDLWRKRAERKHVAARDADARPRDGGKTGSLQIVDRHQDVAAAQDDERRVLLVAVDEEIERRLLVAGRHSSRLGLGHGLGPRAAGAKRQHEGDGDRALHGVQVPRGTSTVARAGSPCSKRASTYKLRTSPQASFGSGHS